MERCDSKINEHTFPFFLIKGNYFILSILSVTELRAQSACFSPCDLRLEMEPAVDVLGKTRNFHGGVRSLGGGYVTAYSALSSPRFARSPENTERRQRSAPPPTPCSRSFGLATGAGRTRVT